MTIPCNQAILLDNFSQFPILGGFAGGKTYVARVSDNTGAGMPMKGVFVMCIDNNEVKYEFVPSGSSIVFTPGSGTYKFCSFQIDWSDISDNTGQTSVNIYSLDGVVGVDDIELGLKNYYLHQNYPNPFNPTTNISYTLPSRSIVKLQIFNSLGQVIRTLVDEEKQAGYYEIDFNAEGLTSGLYFYQLLAGKYKETKKMILLR